MPSALLHPFRSPSPRATRTLRIMKLPTLRVPAVWTFRTGSM